MSQQTLFRGDGGSKATPEADQSLGAIAAEQIEVSPDDVAWMLSQMTFGERVRAYELGSFSRRELCAAAAREPERMPMLNGEFEWIALYADIGITRFSPPTSSKRFRRRGPRVAFAPSPGLASEVASSLAAAGSRSSPTARGSLARPR